VNETWGFGISYKKIVSTRGYVPSEDKRGYVLSEDKQVIKLLIFMFAKWSYSRLWVKEYDRSYDQAEHTWNPADGTKYKDEIEAQNKHRI